MKGLIKHIVPLTTFALFVGCGNVDTSPTMGRALWGGLKARVLGQAEPAKAAPPQITRASFANVTNPVILVQIPSRGATASLSYTRLAKGVTTWSSADGASLATRAGVLVASRGLGQDMMSSQTVGLSGALQRGSGQVTRQMQYLNGEDQTQTLRFSCQVVSMGRAQITILEHGHATHRFREDCTGDWGTFTNMYWLKDGVIWQSGQWLGPEIGPIVVQKVI